jgi:hypothetical protein
MSVPPSIDFLASLITVLSGTWPASSAEDTEMAARAALETFAPRDLAEVMLVARMIAAHHACIDGFRRAMQPGLADADAIRLRANAIAASRAFDAALRFLDKRRAADAKAAQPPKRAAAAAAEAPAEPDELAGYTAQEIAEAEYALDNDPAELARAELAKRIPLHMFNDMTMEERRIAYAERAPMTPVQIAVLGARIAKKMNGSKPAPVTAAGR